MRKVAILAVLLCAGVVGAAPLIRMISPYAESLPPPVMSNWPSGLIGYWSFDEQFNDETTNHNWARIGSAGSITTNARVGAGSLSLNGGVGAVRCWETNYNAYTNNWTLSFWAYAKWAESKTTVFPIGLNQATWYTVANGIRLGGVNQSVWWPSNSIAMDGYNSVYAHTYHSTWKNSDTGAWHNIAIVWSTNGTQCAIYKDGVSLPLSITNAGGLRWPPFCLSFGARPDNGPYNESWPFYGYIDEVSLFGRCLTNTEISLLANPPVTNIPLPLGVAKTNDDSVLRARMVSSETLYVSDASYKGTAWGTRRTGGAAPTWATNKWYNDGGDGIRIPDKDYFSFSNTPLTIGTWLKPYQYQTTNAIMTKTTAGTALREWEMYLSATNPTLAFTLYDSQSNSATWTSNPLNLDTNLWFHAAFSLDGAHQVGRWYTNGALDICSTQTTLTAALRNTTNEVNWMLGNGSWTPFIGWYGNTDIYTNDLPSTVTNIYTAVTGVYTNP